MRSFTRSILAALSLTPAFIVSASPSLAYPPIKPYPNNGDLYYDGAGYADSYFKWFNVGGWVRSNPAFELDMTVNKRMFVSCTTYNNLPQPNYDDCPTAGVSEPNPEEKTFGFGTWNAKGIVNSLTYKGQWYFQNAAYTESYYGYTSPVKISWQEVEKRFCSTESIWCIASVNASILMSKRPDGTPLTLTIGQAAYYQWCLPTGTNCTYP